MSKAYPDPSPPYPELEHEPQAQPAPYAEPPQSYNQPPVTLIAPTPTYNLLTNVSREPAYCVCPFCKETITTSVNFVNGTFTILMALLFGVLFLLCCIPFCFDVFKDAHHHCPRCNALVAIDKRM
uniref:LITAF domain-containing protein n=1 Tax=Panagrellus redivivus TaxID=6233 RepID=A0A7E4USA5_PANRE